MFTGLVESVGKLRRVSRSQGGASFEIDAPDIAGELVPGDSVAVQGVCLTVTSITGEYFRCDVLDETLRRTNLGDKPAGSKLNLERALRMGDRLGGHIVSGHVDVIGSLRRIRRAGRDRILEIVCGQDVAAGIIEKGSIAIDGISLTVSAVSADGFEVNIIPFTWEHTSLAERKEGDSVNLETDMLGKYVKRYLDSVAGKSGLSMEQLVSAGFM